MSEKDDKKQEGSAKKAGKKSAPAKKVAEGTVQFRVKFMKGFKSGQTITVDKKRAAAWQAKGFGTIQN